MHWIVERSANVARRKRRRGDVEMAAGKRGGQEERVAWRHMLGGLTTGVDAEWVGIMV